MMRLPAGLAGRAISQRELPYQAECFACKRGLRSTVSSTAACSLPWDPQGLSSHGLRLMVADSVLAHTTQEAAGQAEGKAEKARESRNSSKGSQLCL